jgi:hypothetical protein
MSDTKPRRGRPRGTGIDDSHWLREIDRNIKAHPGRKVTTAIKAIGIENQSTIRRLRDKYKLARTRNTIAPAASVRTEARHPRPAPAFATRSYSAS